MARSISSRFRREPVGLPRGERNYSVYEIDWGGGAGVHRTVLPGVREPRSRTPEVELRLPDGVHATCDSRGPWTPACGAAGSTGDAVLGVPGSALPRGRGGDERASTPESRDPSRSLGLILRGASRICRLFKSTCLALGT